MVTLRSVSNLPLSPEDLRAVLTWPGGRGLPGAAYTSPAIHRWELEHFFAGSWVCVGRAEEWSQPGCQRAVRAGDETLLLVTGSDGRVRAFYNVCPHRGHELLGCGETAQRGVVQCPYHAWVYSLDGSLRTAPRFGDVPGFDRAENGLTPARVADWGGWLFVNASAGAPELSDHVGDLDGRLAPYATGRLVIGAVRRYEVAANWKVLAENYHECYHCPSIHPELCKVTPPQSGGSFTPAGSWAGGWMDLRDGARTMSLDGSTPVPVLSGLGGDLAHQVLYIDLFPGLLLSLHPDYVLTHRLEPLDAGRTSVECQWLFAPEVVARPDFDPGYAVDFWDVTNAQDWTACESVQRGVASRGYRPGLLSTQEESLHRFLEIVATGYLSDAAPV